MTPSVPKVRQLRDSATDGVQRHRRIAALFRGTSLAVAMEWRGESPNFRRS